jgi:DNA-binding MarR family transcriptional regulator
MFDFFISTAPQRTDVLGRWELTPNDSRALNSLDPEDGRTMRSLADEWQCDASNATWIIDRLERAGLAERRSSPDDRRVKLVGLTAKGVRTKREVMDAFYQPPAELLELSAADLALLEGVMTRLTRDESGRP